MRAYTGPVEERHAERDTALLPEGQQALPDAQARPANKDLSGEPPGSEVGGHGAPLWKVVKRATAMPAITFGCLWAA